jgi:hypothetical protein
MTLIEHCLDQVAAVRESASDPKAAYVIRSRLERLLLTCTRVTAERLGQTRPDLPGPIDASDAPADVQRFAAACDILYDLSSSLCRPSESFDTRWDEAWLRISPALDELEALLESQRARRAAHPAPGGGTSESA